MAKANIYLQKNAEAIPFINELLKLNPANENFFKYLRQAIADDKKYVEEISKRKELKNSLPGQRAILDILQKEEFKAEFSNFIKPYFRKGLPSIFSEIRFLYANMEKVKIIEEVLLINEKSLNEKSMFFDCSEKESPTCLLWNYYVLSMHFDRLGEFAKAIAYADLVRPF